MIRAIVGTFENQYLKCPRPELFLLSSSNIVSHQSDLIAFFGADSDQFLSEFSYDVGAPHVCKCGKSYKAKGSLARHRKYECGKEPQFQCPYCPHRSKLKEHLKTHIVAKHVELCNDDDVSEKGLRCRCGKKYKSLRSLSTHMTNGCDQLAAVALSLMENSIALAGRNTNTKRVCTPTSAIYSDDLSGKRFYCHCGRSYRDKRNLKRHVLYECGKEATFQCPHCCYKAKRKGSLRIHIGVKHWNGSRNRHRRTFLADLYWWTVASFATAGSRTSARKAVIHPSMIPEHDPTSMGRHCRCQCGRTYKHRRSLWRHRKYECGHEARFSCAHCSHVSKRLENMKKHIAMISKKIQYFSCQSAYLLGGRSPPTSSKAPVMVREQMLANSTVNAGKRTSTREIFTPTRNTSAAANLSLDALTARTRPSKKFTSRFICQILI
ncbi:unnamed protein product, partial [Nesidiocoris tenuis]